MWRTHTVDPMYGPSSSGLSPADGALQLLREAHDEPRPDLKIQAAAVHANLAIAQQLGRIADLLGNLQAGPGRTPRT